MNIFNPEVVVVGGGFGAAGELLLEPAREVVAEQALPPAARSSGSIPAELGPEAGLDRRRARRLRDLVARWPLVPARRLPDADREPRGRHAAGAPRARRGGRRPLRGHAPDAGPPRPARRLARRSCSSASTATTRPRARPRCCRACEAGRAGRPRERRRAARRERPGRPADRGGDRARVEVTVLPGPSAVETALVASGLVGERYTFLGYLPRRAGELARLWEELAGWTWPTVAFESPRRLPASLASLAGAHPDRPVAVCRELTKRFEEVVRGSAREVAARFAEPPKGEITLVIGPGAPQREADPDDALGARRGARRGGHPAPRAPPTSVAGVTGRAAEPPLPRVALADAAGRARRCRSGRPTGRGALRAFRPPAEHADRLRASRAGSCRPSP